MVAVATISIQPWVLVCDDCQHTIATAVVARGHRPTAKARCGPCGGRAHWHPNGHAVTRTGLEPVDLAAGVPYASLRRL